MSAQVLPFKLPAFEAVPLPLPLADQLPAGRLTEIVRLNAGAQLSLAVSCVFAAQARGEPVAWLQPEGGSLFPPDLADNGVDLDALLIVHVPIASGPAGLCKAAELLLRSSGFGLVVIDMVTGSGLRTNVTSELRLQAQSRLLGLAREHDSAVLLLSEGTQQRAQQSTWSSMQHASQHASQHAPHDAPHASLGPLVGLCIEPHRERVGRGAFRIEPRARKDKSGSLCVLAQESRRGPWGLL